MNMTDDPYSNREIKSMIERIDEKQDTAHTSIIEKMDKGFERITDRQDIANGRISKNELWINRAMGAVAVLSLIGLPLLILALTELANLDDTIDERIETSLQDYEFELSP